LKTLIIIALCLSLISIFFNGCKKEQEQKTEPINIILRDKPLSVIEEYISGKWKLNYAYGGFITQKYIDTFNSYVIFSPGHIIYGDDLRGIYIDTTIIWERVKINFDSIYIFTYPYSGDNPPMHQIIDQIKYDTLIILDYAADGFTYFHTKY